MQMSLSPPPVARQRTGGVTTVTLAIGLSSLLSFLSYRNPTGRQRIQAPRRRAHTSFVLVPVRISLVCPQPPPPDTGHRRRRITVSAPLTASIKGTPPANGATSVNRNHAIRTWRFARAAWLQRIPAYFPLRKPIFFFRARAERTRPRKRPIMDHQSECKVPRASQSVCHEGMNIIRYRLGVGDRRSAHPSARGVSSIQRINSTIRSSEQYGCVTRPCLPRSRSAPVAAKKNRKNVQSRNSPI